jgi:sugar/nucleoside kinase (ribokinase family)
MTLVSVGNVVVDILTRVPDLPEPGGDVLATGAGMSPGGSFNALFAAIRQGLPAAYAGGHGTGFFGDLVRSRLGDCGVGILLAQTNDLDSGYDIALVDDRGERTFVTVFGAEAHVSAEALAAVCVEPSDFVHVSGYGLLDSTNADVLAPWLPGLDRRVRVLLDPGPLVDDIRLSVLAGVLERADWLSCNEREAITMTGAVDAPSAIAALAGSCPGVIVRAGANGALLAVGGEVTSVPAFRTQVVDTNGAGDAHTGAFLAALAAGLSPIAAAVRANACAAIAVSRFGPATAPTLDEVLELIRSQGRGE